MAAMRINTPRFRLEPFGFQHLTDQYVAWLNDKKLMQYSEQQFRTHSRESCIEYAKRFDHLSSFLWAIIDSQSGWHVGNINAHFQPHHRLADIGILVGERDMQGTGVGREAWWGVTQAMFRELRCRKVTGGCVAANHAMIRIMERCGMRDDGCRMGQYVYNNCAVDVQHMAIFEEDFTHDPGIQIQLDSSPDWLKNRAS